MPDNYGTEQQKYALDRVAVAAAAVKASIATAMDLSQAEQDALDAGCSRNSVYAAKIR